MNAGKDAHRHVSRIVAHKHPIDLENRAQLPIQNFSRNMRQIEIDLVLSADAKAVEAHLKDLARGDVARHEVAVSRIPLFEEVPAFVPRNLGWRPKVALPTRHPNTSTFPTRRFRHQSQLIFAGNRRWMNLDELTVRVSRALLITG